MKAYGHPRRIDNSRPGNARNGGNHLAQADQNRIGKGHVPLCLFPPPQLVRHKKDQPREHEHNADQAVHVKQADDVAVQRQDHQKRQDREAHHDEQARSRKALSFRAFFSPAAGGCEFQALEQNLAEILPIGNKCGYNRAEMEKNAEGFHVEA